LPALDHLCFIPLLCLDNNWNNRLLRLPLQGVSTML